MVISVLKIPFLRLDLMNNYKNEQVRRPLRSAIVTINSKEVLANPELSPEVSLLLNNLASGH
jgi:hypothetical protein